MKQLSNRTGCAVLAAAALLAGCGGGSDDSGPVMASGGASQVPAAALQSAEGLVAFLRSVNQNGTDSTSAPLALGDAAFPKTDTAEPSPVN
ncbi:hypothetical protein WG902_20175 [Ramlibacter sp. PS3R-8]|uniref:hypothetical protein n=1 Tax=Ramlibacter sp. PS3R-8 TaxID=3133437 RepID=UPI0030B39AB6